MSSIGAFSGVASGLQWRDMIDQIVYLDSRPAIALREKASALNTRAAAWDQYRSRIATLGDRAKALANATALNSMRAAVSGSSAAPLGVSASSSAVPGSYAVKVVARAESEKLGGAIVADRTSALGADGEFVVNGRRIAVNATDTLESLTTRINGAGAGVAATIQNTAHGSRLVLTSTRTGAAGIDLVDGTGGVLRQLGLADGSTTLKHRTSAGFRSDAFAATDQTIAAMRGFEYAAVGRVTLGSGASAFSVDLDLGTMSLDDARAAIDAAAIAAGSAVRADVVADTTGSSTSYRLVVNGTAGATDDGGVLQALGVLAPTHGAVSQQLRGAALTVGAAAATADATLASIGGGVGDTIRMDGTRADGSAFSFTHTIAAGDSLQTLLDRLNGAEGYDGSATASVDSAGRMIVSDAVGGPSSLGLAIFADNESGSSLDFGAFGIERPGYARQISAGRDAVIEVDGVRFTRAANQIADVVTGVTFNITAAAPDTTLDVTVSRDVEAASRAVRDFVEAYNAVSEFAMAGTGLSGAARPPLAGDAVVRGMRDMLRAAMQSTIAPGVTAFQRLSGIGVTLGRDGRFSIDSAALDAALRSDALGVSRLFAAHAESSNTAARFVAAGDLTLSGSYAVNITTAASRASAIGQGFTGQYAATGADDILRISDAAGTFTVPLTHGMSAADAVTAINAELGSARAHVLGATASLFAADGTTPADSSVSLTDLRAADGSSLALDAGRTLTFSGTRSDGSAFFAAFTVADPASQTLEDVRAAIAGAIGPGAVAAFEDGQLTLRATGNGASQLSLNASSDAAAEFPFGSMHVVQQGRAASSLRADVVDGEVRLAAASYGAAHSFSIAATAGAAGLGITAGEFAGSDVAGTIGGHAATGSGRTLTAAAGSDAAGLVVSVDAGVVGDAGTMVFSRGVAASAQRIAELLVGTGDGSIHAVRERLDASAAAMKQRADQIEDRVERRREELVRRFTAMERALSAAQAQSQWLSAQISALQPQQRR